MANNYNLMAQYIVEKYINRISGDDIEETFVEEAPQDRVMVGMLAEDRMEQSLTGGYVENNKTRFESVPSMSVSFVVKKNAKGILQVIPKGLLFYTVEPDYEKTVEYILAKYSEKDSTPYTSIPQLCDAYPEAKFMYFFGMPNNNAEYIQAYSRVGRKYAGIVIDIIRLMRVRDRSYLKNFIVFHQNKDDLVESVPVNRWAKNAVYSTLPGMLSGLLMQYYTVETDSEDFYHAYKVKKLLMNGTIDIDEVASILVELYGCNSQEKLSEGYKEIIEQQTHAILEGIKNNDFSREMFFSDAISLYSKGKKKPMRSLRDTEETLEIEITLGQNTI